MDKSEKAEEIQERWQPQTADFYCYASRVHTIRNYLADQVKTFGAIWLPRQDQLQEMVGTHTLYELVKLFESFCCLLPWGQSPHQSGGRFYGMCYTSMEQLWLAFVTFELSQKKWDGENWVV